MLFHMDNSKSYHVTICTSFCCRIFVCRMIYTKTFFYYKLKQPLYRCIEFMHKIWHCFSALFNLCWVHQLNVNVKSVTIFISLLRGLSLLLIYYVVSVKLLSY